MWKAEGSGLMGDWCWEEGSRHLCSLRKFHFERGRRGEIEEGFFPLVIGACLHAQDHGDTASHTEQSEVQARKATADSTLFPRR